MIPFKNKILFLMEAFNSPSLKGLNLTISLKINRKRTNKIMNFCKCQ